VTRFLDFDGVVVINKFLTGDDFGIRDKTALISAVGEPSQGAFGVEFHETLYEKAAALMRGLARNHPFIDGNKRTALMSTDAFFRANDYAISARPNELVKLTLAVAQGQCELTSIAGHLRSWTKPLKREQNCVLQSVRVLSEL
jgi:death on curing protein